MLAIRTCSAQSWCVPLPAELVQWVAVVTIAFFVVTLVWAIVTIRRRRGG